MPAIRLIKADRLAIPLEIKLRTWAGEWGAPVAVTVDFMEALQALAERLRPDLSVLRSLPPLFRQIFMTLRRNPQVGKCPRGAAELVGFEVGQGDDREDIFAGVRVSPDGTLFLFSDDDLTEDA